MECIICGTHVNDSNLCQDCFADLYERKEILETDIRNNYLHIPDKKIEQMEGEIAAIDELIE